MKLTLINNVNVLVDNILGGIDVQSDFTNDAPHAVENPYVPVRFEIQFIRDPREIEDSEFDVADTFRSRPEGEFFPYINTTDIDLIPLQIFSSVDKNNYRDNCFVYACIQSGVFTRNEISHLRSIIQTRSLPNNKIIEVAKAFKCNFVVKRIDEKKDIKHQMEMKIDTRKKDFGKTFKRCVELLLFKGYYMFNKKLPIRTFYIKHKEEIYENFPHIEKERRCLTTGFNNKSFPKINNKDEGLEPITILREMFKQNMFREINKCERNILSTVEFDNNLNDYVELDYDEELCCREETTSDKKQIQ